jgi:recombination protein RecA
LGVDTTKKEEVIKAIEKEYGADNIHTGSDVINVPRIPYDSMELNIATGGGAPVGRMVRIWGNYSSGKSLTSLGLIKNAQNLPSIAEKMLDSEYDTVKRRGEQLLELFPEGLEVILYNVEGTYDKVFAEKIGVDTDRLLVVEGTQIEELGSKVEAALGAFHLHVIDSLGFAASVDELSSDIEDWHRGIKARAINKVLDHTQSHLDKSNNLVVFLDQARIDMMTGAEYAPGGLKVEHASAQTLHLKRGKWLFRRDGVLTDQAEKSPKTISKQPEADGYEVRIHVTKSKVGRPLRRATLQVDFETMRFDQAYELAKVAPYFGIVKQAGAWFELPNGEKVQGMPKLREELQQDKKLKHEVIDAVEKVIAENP